MKQSHNQGSSKQRRLVSMKWNVAVASLVASLAICSQSFGFDLLDRMLGGSGCGCASSCCETQSTCCDVGPSCGCDMVSACDPCGDPCCNKPLIEVNLPKIRPLFKINRSCGCGGCEVIAPTCGCDMTPSCGCGAAPSCGCDMTPSCGGCGSCCGKKKLSLGLLDKIFACKKGCGCASMGPSCGCDMTPSCGCDATPSCGCGGAVHMHSAPATPAPAPAPVAEGDSASLPPTPIVDPSAFVSPRNVLKVSNR